MSNLSKTIELLETLSSDELSQLSALVAVRVVNVANQTKSGKSTGPSSKGSKNPPPSSKKKKKDGKAKAEPKVSEYKDIPEYKEYKASDKALKSYLDGQEGEFRLLSYYVNSQSTLDSMSDEDRSAFYQRIPNIVAGFLQARDCWFRTKRNLSSAEPTPDSQHSQSDEKEQASEEGSVEQTDSTSAS